jgi:hypothetical protein
MPFADAVKIAESFRRYPPLHGALAIQVGWKQPEPRDVEEGPAEWPRGPVKGA